MSLLGESELSSSVYFKINATKIVAIEKILIYHATTYEKHLYL
jgi:hypothetical protein